MIIKSFVEARRVIQDTISYKGLSFAEIASGAGVSSSTVRNLFNEKTNSPHFRTVIGILVSLGYEVRVSSRKKSLQRQLVGGKK